jgi:hypothetical protein
LKKPEKKQEKQVRTLCEYLLGSRNFILLVTKDTSHTLALYFWIAGVWSITTQKGFVIKKPIDLDPFKEDYQEQIQRMRTTGLLILPYSDPTDYNLRKTKNALGGVLSDRKAKRKPTITDVFSRQEPRDTDLPNLINSLSSVYGEQCVPMYLDEKSNSKILRVRS